MVFAISSKWKILILKNVVMWRRDVHYLLFSKVRHKHVEIKFLIEQSCQIWPKNKTCIIRSNRCQNKHILGKFIPNLHRNASTHLDINISSFTVKWAHFKGLFTNKKTDVIGCLYANMSYLGFVFMDLGDTIRYDL